MHPQPRKSPDFEDEHLEIEQIAQATGKDDLGGGKYTAITLKLVNGWRVKFEERTEPTLCMILGGNLLAVDEAGNSIWPISPSTNITTIIAQSTAPGLIAEWERNEIDYVKTQVGYIPSDLPEVPTMPELNAAHGSGSWEGATPEQIWKYSARTLSSRDIPEVPSEQIASEQTSAKIEAELAKLVKRASFTV